jgi:hypothetical protein
MNCGDQGLTNDQGETRAAFSPMFHTHVLSKSTAGHPGVDPTEESLMITRKAARSLQR